MNKSQQNDFLVEVLAHLKLNRNEVLIYKYLFEKWFESIALGVIYCASQKEIGAPLGLKQGVVSRAIDELVKKQLITRYPNRVQAVEVYLVTPPDIALTLLDSEEAA